MGNDISRANDANSYYTRAVDNAIRSATPSISGDSPVRSFGLRIDSAIRSSTASSTDSLGLSGLENFEITPAPFQQAQVQHDRVASPPPPPPPNTVNLQQSLLQTEERLNGVTPPLLPLNTVSREMKSQLVCNGCRILLLYPRGATNVCCALGNTITSVLPPGMEESLLYCGGCRTLLMYTRGATIVRCSCCHTVNLVPGTTC